MNAFIWHDASEIPSIALPVIVKTNYVGTYYIAVYDNGWQFKNGKRYVRMEEVKFFSPNEKITGWAYVNGESI